MNSELQLLIIQFIIMAVLFMIIVFLLKQNRAIRYEKRIGRYSIESLKYDSKSVFDIVSERYKKNVIHLRKVLYKLRIFNHLAKRYQKYVVYGERDNIEPIDYIVHKLFLGIGFVLLTVFSQVLQVRVISLLELFFYFLIGYFILDIYMIYRQKLRVKQIENEMLKAVIIMNNAFKAGKSTLQAVEIASLDLPEPISEEFKKIYQDLKFGLSIDTVFERFAKRINIEEARYLSSSLTILNKTGGNIVNVFSSIERTLFDKKKLQEELKNLTVSSNMIVRVLLFIPFIFVLVIYLLNPNYFNPLFESTLGYLTMLAMIITFIIYIVFLQKIMKVKV